MRPLPLLVTHTFTDRHHLLYRLWLQQIVVIQVIEENVDPLFNIIDLRLECLRSDGLNMCHGW